MNRTGARGRSATAGAAAAKRKKIARENDRQPSLAESVYLAIKQDIFEFRLLPGDRFTENELAGRLNVSRTPARQALFRLEREGYLQVHFRSGWSVRELDFKQFDDLYDLRIALETAAVSHLCAQAEPAGLDELKSVWLGPTAKRLDDGERVCALDEAFHCALVVATGNREMARCHQEVTERIHVLRRLDFTEAARIAATYQEHAQILQAVLRRDADRAIGLLRGHIETSKIEVRKISLHKLLSARRS